MNCPKCDFELPENSKFCPKCGTKVANISIEEETKKENDSTCDKIADHLEFLGYEVSKDKIKNEEKKEQEKKYVKVFYFGLGSALEEAEGEIIKLSKNDINEEYLVLTSGKEVRIDRIITVNGKPGPAYDEYDRYALACLDCTSGME